jgi:hypothetical protein
MLNARKPAARPATPSADGPKLLFDRGILARWFIHYRLIEEIDRASRYARPIAVMVARPELLPGERLTSDARTAASTAAARAARNTDLVGWLSDESILIVMPETSPNDARAAVHRVQSEMWLHSNTRGGRKWQVIILDQLDEFSTLERFQESLDSRQGGAVA